ncbi:toxin-antitoxin system HicB family antitoxin [Acidovorax sp. NCPPB 3576]|uniref:toxin-antitoxin system HicB family antitoxin n=1 Tax=Acidovorax sp. NCPPB 3576 TaxID=2940488 RepID=UPI0023494AEF|nr:toxin-antitoxin system HicB family antitoxin [Acidovorax sp. NCPPB 3576]WCM88812.1 type II toxin-antitoxin system HicB family antitoxin [Acidovorax sp. NCPPB 3576]
MDTQQPQGVTFTLRVPGPLQEKAKGLAKSEHLSLNSLIVRLLEREVAQKGQQQ